MSHEEISSELIKLSLLRLIKNKSRGEYKWNLLSGIAHGESALEVSLGVTFDEETKYRASVCFDELRRDGYILPFENLNTNPDDWVKITEKGLKALEAGKVDVHATDHVASADLSDFGIPNLRAFKKEVSKLVDDEMVSCLFMDLDNFKAVNDTHNHSVGDEVIQEAIRIVESVVKGKGRVFHRSGDEILVLLPNFDLQEACAVAERIRSCIEAANLPVIGQGFVTATLGVATSPTFCKLDQLEQIADGIAMRAKKLGKNQVDDCSGTTQRLKKDSEAKYKGIQTSALLEVYETQERTLQSLEACSQRIEILSLLLGRSDAFYYLLGNRGWGDKDRAEMSLRESEIKSHEADIWNMLQEKYGSFVAENHFKKFAAMPVNLLEQVERINSHRNKLHGLLQSERAQLVQIGLKASAQKEKILERFKVS